MSQWRRRAGLVLLLLIAVGSLAPAASALGLADPCCAALQGAAEPPARCQWILATSLCDEGAVVGDAPPFAAPAVAPAPAIAPWPAELAPGIPMPASVHPASHRLALATIVLRL